MKELKYLIIHCTATPKGRQVTKADILHWHTAPKSQGGFGWRRPGYTDLVDIHGQLINITPFNQDNKVDPWEITYGARGLNGVSRHIAYAGGYRGEDTRTSAQLEALETYVRYMILRHPNIKILGHNQVSNKQCPSFDVPLWLSSIDIPTKNIYR